MTSGSLALCVGLVGWGRWGAVGVGSGWDERFLLGYVNQFTTLRTISSNGAAVKAPPGTHRARSSDQGIDGVQWADDLAVPTTSSPGSRRPAWTSSTVGHRCPISAPVWVGDQVTAAREAITMWARVVLPARHGAGWPPPKSQHGLGRQEGLGS